MPTQPELDLLIELFHQEEKDYSVNLIAARALTNIGESSRNPSFEVAELAAYTSIANAILNLTEATQKG